MGEKSIWDVLNHKVIKCRYCNALMEMETHGYNCPSDECGGAYKEQHWYVKFKNGAIMNLWDYFEFNIPDEYDIEKCMEIAEYELKDKRQ